MTTPPQLPLGSVVERLVEWLLLHGSGVFAGLSLLIDSLHGALETALAVLPATAVLILFAGLAVWRIGWRGGVLVSLSLSIVVGMGLWGGLVSTLALVLTATLLSLATGLPLGVWAARNDLVDRLVRPLLDVMQTLPAFVYLIPAVMFFGLGRVPGVVATVIFAMPPAVRLTNIGIRQVPRDLVEAGLACGCNRWQLLHKVQIPAALPSILAGMNQNIMLALSMVVIASMIGAGGLGDGVLRGIQRLDIGLGFESGVAVVLLAIVLDRITQSFGRRRRTRQAERR